MNEGLYDGALSWLVHSLQDEVERALQGEDGGLEAVQRGWKPQLERLEALVLIEKPSSIILY